MSMTREEAIEVLENGGWWDLLIPVTTIEGRIEDDKLHEALDLAIAALRPVSREQVEKIRGEWIDIDGETVPVDKYGQTLGWAECSACGQYLTASDEYPCTGHFCPNCGAPMTDEAVEMVMERLEAIFSERNDE